jgi:hypothetical protein
MGFFNGVTPKSVDEASGGFMEFKIGENKAYIKMVMEKNAKESGNPMLEITFASEDGAEIKHYIVDGEYKLSKLKQLYTAFGIQPQDYTNLGKWLYKEGIVVCKQGEPYNGNVYNKVNYLKPLPYANIPVNTKPVNPVKVTPPNISPPQGQEQSDDNFWDDVPF